MQCILSDSRLELLGFSSLLFTLKLRIGWVAQFGPINYDASWSYAYNITPAHCFSMFGYFSEYCGKFGGAIKAELTF